MSAAATPGWAEKPGQTSGDEGEATSKRQQDQPSEASEPVASKPVAHSTSTGEYHMHPLHQNRYHQQQTLHHQQRFYQHQKHQNLHQQNQQNQRNQLQHQRQPPPPQPRRQQRQHQTPTI